jgi:heme-degrading monooxygenase HmoA
LTGSKPEDIDIKNDRILFVQPAIAYPAPKHKETVMNAKILIKRKFKKGKQKEVLALLRELRSGALNQPGYISGQTLTSTENPRTMMVIGTWQDMESWYNWKRNSMRQTLEQMLETYQVESTEYQEFKVGAFIED